MSEIVPSESLGRGWLTPNSWGRGDGEEMNAYHIIISVKIF